MTRLAAARVVTPAGIVGPATVVVEGERIVSVDAGTSGGDSVLEGTLAPGFVDLQVNGIGPVGVATAGEPTWSELDDQLVASGVTAWCPTLVSAPLESYDAKLATIAAAAERDGARPAVLGAHLEGPFLGGAPGAHRREHVVPIDRDWLGRTCDRWPVRIVTLAPELPGALGAVRDLAGRGVTVALGHSTASYEDARAAADAGATLVTHCFNAMAPLHHREPGLLGAALSDDRLRVSLIADLVHVHAAALSIACRAKGSGGFVLVTDAVAGAGGAPPGDGEPPRLADGTLAGSALTMDRAVANVVAHAGVLLADAIHAASAVAADLVGAHDRGRVAAGYRADLVLLDDELRVQATWIGGEQVWPRASAGAAR
jgi:N-acetylglucosamine-6-phosphate deacetylase